MWARGIIGGLSFLLFGFALTIGIRAFNRDWDACNIVVRSDEEVRSEQIKLATDLNRSNLEYGVPCEFNTYAINNKLIILYKLYGDGVMKISGAGKMKVKILNYVPEVPHVEFTIQKMPRGEIGKGIVIDRCDFIEFFGDSTITNIDDEVFKATGIEWVIQQGQKIREL